jgi:hypothetical protein
MTDLVDKDQIDPNFEREKWEADLKLRSQELAIKRAEIGLKKLEARRTWTSPLVLAVLAAAFAAGGNAVVALINGYAQRQVESVHNDAQLQLERFKIDGQQTIEESKAEALRIFEMIKTPDQEQVIKNLRFLLKSGLVVNDARRKQLAEFIDQTKPTEAPTTSQNLSLLELDPNAPASVDGDWLLFERSDQTVSSFRVHLVGKTDQLEGTLSSEYASNGSVFGYYRRATLIFSYASTASDRSGLGSVMMKAANVTAARPVFVGYLTGNHLSPDGKMQTVSCPAILMKEGANQKQVFEEIPRPACTVLSP